MLPNLYRLNLATTESPLDLHDMTADTGPPAVKATPIEKQRLREAQKVEKARQKAISEAVEKERKQVLNALIKGAKAEVKDNPPMETSKYGLGRGQAGVTVIPFADEAELESLRALLKTSFNSSPEFKPSGFYGDSTFSNDDFVPVEGGFAGLATPSSFHNQCVRKIRMAAHVAVLRSGVVPIPNDCAFEQISDRLMIRRSRKTPGAEMWHRDAATFAKPGDIVYGGWVNLDRYLPQYFSCCPGTANEIEDGRNYGFDPIPDTEAPANIRRSVRIEIPPGHIMIFNERTIHEVLAISSPPGVTKARLFMGWRSTRSADPITPNLYQRLINQEALPLKSGQHPHINPPPGSGALMRSIVGPERYDSQPADFKYPGPPPMWSPMHLCNRSGAKLLQNLGTHFKDAVLVQGGYKFKNPEGELGCAYPAPSYLRTVPQFLPSLRELNAHDATITMFPDYSHAELSLLWPNVEWNGLLDLQGRRINIKMNESPTGFKAVQLEEEVSPADAVAQA